MDDLFTSANIQTTQDRLLFAEHKTLDCLIRLPTGLEREMAKQDLHLELMIVFPAPSGRLKIGMGPESMVINGQLLSFQQVISRIQEEGPILVPQGKWLGDFPFGLRQKKIRHRKGFGV